MTDQLTGIYSQLSLHYGPCNWWPAETPFEVCVGAILTQNTNWRNVEKAISNLKREGLLSCVALLSVPAERLADIIKPSGFYNLKSRRLKGFVQWLFERHSGSLERMLSLPMEQLREELLKVHGIGCETADSILLYAGHKPSFVVDSYTKRLFGRLGILDGELDYESVRDFFMARLPADTALFNEYHALIVVHCKEYCRKKPLCNDCILRQSCQMEGNCQG